MDDLSNKTLSQIVTGHYQTARVFEKYRLDFCCKGKRSLVSACEEFEIPVENILEELYQVLITEEKGTAFNEMKLTELATYIVRVHHSYVKLNSPLILSYTMKVASKHGDRFPFMKEVYFLFEELVEELNDHMDKEETILFPRISLLELNASQNEQTPFLNGPIAEIKHEHDLAGEIMSKIRGLTNDYSIPEQACTTFRLTLDSLKAFEEDLHRHVHLENNILFPKAIRAFSNTGSCLIG